MNPHILLLDEPTNHLDIEVRSFTLASLRKGTKTNRRTQGLDALMAVLNSWNGGVIIISHDERFITNVAKEVHTLSFLVTAYERNVLTETAELALGVRGRDCDQVQG